jgi:hypothetical protein
MAKNQECIASAYTSAGAFVVTTGPAAFVGISILGSAAATTIQVFDGTSTGGSKIAVVQADITAGGFHLAPVPICCSAGIVATNIGTVAGYVIYYYKK